MSEPRLSLSAEAVSEASHYVDHSSTGWWQCMRLMSALADRGLVNRYSDRLAPDADSDELDRLSRWSEGWDL